MTPDNLLNEEALYNAMRLLFSLEYWKVCEKEGKEEGDKWFTPAKTIISDLSPNREVLLPLGWYLIGRVEQAWGHPVGLIFYHAGITSADDQEHALGDLFLGCQGHGVTLADDFAGHLRVAAAILRRFSYDPDIFDLVPFDDEMEWLRELAEEVLEAQE